MLIATFSHRGEQPNWKAKVDTLAEALVRAVEDEYGIEDLSLGEAEAAIALAKEKGEAPIYTQDGPLVVWWENDGENFGVGEGESVNESDKYTNIWIELGEAKVPEGQREKYEAMSKKELVELLLERDALDPNGPP
jgi:hypothetical protein